MSCGPPTRSVGPADRLAGLLVGQTHLSGTAVSLVGGDPGVPMSHSNGHQNKARYSNSTSDVFCETASSMSL
jgi:hypothetical protein